MSTFYLIACCSQKAAGACYAQELYKSDLFKKARAYVEAQLAAAELPAHQWGILSALYGFVPPYRTIAPYDVTLLNKRPSERESWASALAVELGEHLKQYPSVDRVELLAGNLYARPLIPKLEALGLGVSRPLAGLGIGHQKQKLAMLLREHLKERER